MEEEEKGRQEEEEKMGELVVWPNPTSGVLSVKVLGLSECSACGLQIYDMFGREIRKLNLPENDHVVQINVGNFPQGLYLVVLRDRSKIIASSKLVISR